MATWYLNADNGNDSTGNGSSGSPYLTLAKALTVYADGDTIYFQNSTALYTMTGATITKNCTIEGQSIDGVVQDGGGGVVGWIIRDATVTVKKMTFYNLYSAANGTFGYGFINPYNMTNDTNITIEDIILREYYSTNHLLGGFIGSFAVPTSKTLTWTLRRIKGKITAIGTNSCIFSFRTGNASSTINFSAEDMTIEFDPAGYTSYFYYLDNLAAGTVTQTMAKSIFTNRTANTWTWRNIFGSSTWAVDSSVCLHGLTSIHSSITSQGVTTSNPLLVDPDNENYNLRQGSPLL